MTPLEILLLVGLGLLLVLVALVFTRINRLSEPAPDPRIDQLTERMERLQESSQATTQHAVTLAERTLHLAQAYKDLESLKERTDQLPKKLETLEGHTKTNPETHKSVQVIDHQLKPLQGFIQDTQERLGIVRKQLDPIGKTVPATAERVGRVEERLRILAKIDRQLEELHGVFRSTTGKGQIGEDAVRKVLAWFPDDAWVEKPQLPTGTADFGVYTPNGLLMPIDSKTGGADDIKGYLDALDKLEQAQHDATTAPEAEIEQAEAMVREATKRVNDAQRKINERVKKAARDIQKYIVPESDTTPFVLQALPDAVFDAVEPRIRQEASARGVIAVPYDLLHPMASSVRRMQAHHELDAARVSAAVVKVREAGTHIEETVKNQIERAATMAANGAQTIRQDLNAMHAALLSAEMVEPEQRTLTAT